MRYLCPMQHVEIQSQQDLWDWLAANHMHIDSIWLVTWKAAYRDRYVSRDEVLDALISFGWIDGRRMKVDADRTKQLITPRRQKAWAASYKTRAARLEAEGRMQQSGRAAIAASKAAGLWDATGDIDALEVPDDLAAALRAAGARSWWDGAAPSYRRNVLRWVAAAKRSETRGKRVGIIADHAARGEKVPQY